MTAVVISEDIKSFLLDFLKVHPRADLIHVYSLYIERKFNLAPVAYPRGKTIYLNVDEAIKHLEAQGELWRETQIKIAVGTQPVNENTKKIYICPFTGKVFGDNTHPNPQDAIYDWVSRCPENTERLDGLRVKRFYVSEDPNVIKNYIAETKKTISKTVYSSVATGKLFHSKEAVISDFTENRIKYMNLLEVQNQNRFEIEEDFLTFLQKYLHEDKIALFVESLVGHDEFSTYITQWIDSDDSEESGEE
jgi:hypothetical protein